jgi:hypothetical protein
MIPQSFRIIGAPAILALVLTACGGGNSSDLELTPVGATITVANSTSPTFNGVYTTDTISLTDVQRIDPIGSQPEVCSFRFTGPTSPSGQTMSGDVRYRSTTQQIYTIFISIAGFEFRADDPSNATVQTADNQLVLSNKVLTASTGVSSTITVNGIVPLRGGRPGGC